jgi:transketolase
MTPRAAQVGDLLAVRGISTTLVHVPTLKPLDVQTITSATGNASLVVTYEDHSVLGGLGSAVAEVLSENRRPPLLRIGTEDSYIDSGKNDDLMRLHGLEPDVVVDRITAALER